MKRMTTKLAERDVIHGSAAITTGVGFIPYSTNQGICHVEGDTAAKETICSKNKRRWLVLG